MPQPTDLFCHTIFFVKFSILTSFSLQALVHMIFQWSKGRASPVSMEGPFSKGCSWQMGHNFWEANLLRGNNDQIIMPRAGEFSLGVASEDRLEVCFVGLVVRGSYVWCLVIFVIFMGFGGAEVGDALKSSFGGGSASHNSGEAILMGNEVWGSHYM